jgi:hypothetical protein
MRRSATLPSQHGSSTVETLMLVALASLLAAALVGAALVMSLGQRSVPAGTAPRVPAAASESVATLRIACGAGEASLEGEAVDATSGGVPVRVAGDDGVVVSFASPGESTYRMRVFEASGSYLLPLAPGGWSVGCAGSGMPGVSTALGAFEVRDPAGIYQRARPDCPATGCCQEIVDLPAGFTEDDLGTLREGLASVGLRPTDTIERAAYPTSTFSARPPRPLVYRIVRDLQIVARLDVGGHGDLWSAGVQGCPAG